MRLKDVSLKLGPKCVHERGKLRQSVIVSSNTCPYHRTWHVTKCLLEASVTFLTQNPLAALRFLAQNVSLIDGRRFASVAVLDLGMISGGETGVGVPYGLTSYRGLSSLAWTLRPVIWDGSVVTVWMTPTDSDVFESGPVARTLD